MLPQYDEITTSLNNLKTSMESRRQPWVSIWQELSDFCWPIKSYWGNDGTSEGQASTRQLFNTTAVSAVQLASSGFQGYTAARTMRFFRLQTTDPDLMKWPGVADWLETAERILLAELNRSNFYEALGTLVPQGLVLGTSPLYVEDDRKNARVIFQARHMKEMFIDEDPYGFVDTAIREYPASGKALLQKFGSNLPENLAADSKADPIRRFMIQHIVMPMDHAVAEAYDWKISKDFPYIVIWRSVEDQKILDVAGSWEFPYPTWRQYKNSDETYGRSDAMNALVEVKGANQISRSKIKLAQQASDPAFLALDTLQGNDEIAPGGRIYVENLEKTVMKPIGGEGNFAITDAMEKRVDDIIHRFFHTDTYLTLQMAERQMTAFETDARLSEKAAILAPMTDRYNTEILSPVIKRVFAICLRAGRMPPPPDMLMKSGDKLSIDFVGYLSQLQKKHFQTAGLMSSLQYIGATAQLFPNALDVIDGDDLMRQGADGFGAPQSSIRETPDIKAIRATRQQAQQQAMQQQAEQQMMEKVAGRVNPDAVPEDGSLTQKVLNQ